MCLWHTCATCPFCCQTHSGRVPLPVSYTHLDPAGDAAVTAVDDGQVLFGLLSVQIMRNFISDVFRIDLGNDAPQFPDPKLHLYIQE